MNSSMTTNCMKDGDPSSAKLMIIGMAPGREELDQNRPFVGGTGQILWSILKQYGIDRTECFMLNTIGEYQDSKSGPSPEQFDKYWDEFDSSLQQFNGKAILLLGRDAFWRVTGLSGGIESWRGYMVKPTDTVPIVRQKQEMGTYKSGPRKGQPKKINHKVSVVQKLPPSVGMLFPTLHPAFIMRTGFGMLPALSADIDRAVRFLNGQIRPSRTEYTTVPVPTNCDGPVAFDIETAGIGGGLDRIGIADNDRTWTRYWDNSAKQTSIEVLGSSRVKVAHNISFDYPRLEAAGVAIKQPIADTMLMAAMLQPDMPKGLEFVASMYLDGERWKHESAEKPAYYNARDASATLEIFYILDEELKKSGQHDLFHSIIMPGVVELMQMTKTGLYLHPARKAEWIASLQGRLKILHGRWQAMWPTVSHKSPAQLKTLLYSTLGLPQKFDKYGTLTTNELAIRELLYDHPECEDTLKTILELRSAEKDLATYASQEVSFDGCVHPSYLPAGKDDDRHDPDTGEVIGKGLAGTWRPTAKNPNIQNQTRDAKRMYVPRRPGHLFVEMDYSAFEARILAALAGDRVLKKAIENGLHKANMELLGVDKVRAKNAFYGWSYGAGARTLQRTFRAKGFDVSFGDCKRMLKQFDERYRDSRAWRDSQIQLASKQHYVENPFGLKRYFYARDNGTAPANTPIQSTAAIIMWKVLPQTGAAIRAKDGLQVAMVHDSTEFEVPEGTDMSEIRDIAQQTFDCIEPGFYVPVEIKAGPSWGECQ